ncbi:NAD-dependent epimerase/dehydratase family protein [Arenimonas oryziterrae]|uniref:NAD-dependent epimerase/dehydratase domain-containing protein n=1 Tax=Arenimonas oryziterrae DSM 21050 = YC6267 TaxID=1121015 RepID=A0A091AZ99_9GAMM|nr:NAD-dependent epimerase/dehydratase family protein [Arenimonas oryziterrae]KFN44632.1 hypothetical protein N789_01080 [Arenimonas oryziterrae DSM 21050 = YC6267]
MAAAVQTLPEAAPRRVLVTGASGFVAASLVRRLLAQGHEVHGLVREHSDLWRLAELEDRITLHRADLCDATRIAGIFAAVRPHWLFHLATARAAHEGDQTYAQSNVLAAAGLIAACRQQTPERVIVHGSSLEYGHRDLPLREDMTPQPTTAHGQTKAEATAMWLQAARDDGLPVTVLRLFSVYGPWESSARLLPKALLAGLAARELPLTPPGIRRDYVHVDDVVTASLRAIGADATIGEVVNIGSGEQTSNEELVARIDALTGGRLRLAENAHPRHENDAGHWVADTGKCRTLLGWSPTLTLDEGLRGTLAWLREHRHLAMYV